MERVDDMISRMTIDEKIANLDNGAPAIKSLGLNGYHPLAPPPSTHTRAHTHTHTHPHAHTPTHTCTHTHTPTHTQNTSPLSVLTYPPPPPRTHTPHLYTHTHAATTGGARHQRESRRASLEGPRSSRSPSPRACHSTARSGRCVHPYAHSCMDRPCTPLMHENSQSGAHQ
jgi:hypothetical protein